MKKNEVISQFIETLKSQQGENFKYSAKEFYSLYNSS